MDQYPKETLGFYNMLNSMAPPAISKYPLSLKSGNS